MTQRIIALTGVSGVGKSTLVEELQRVHRIQALCASDILAADGRQTSLLPHGARGRALGANTISINQEHLIAGFHDKRDPRAPCVVLDCYVLIDAPTGYVGIDASVFFKLGITHIVMLVDDPEQITARRKLDGNRQRLRRTPQEISKYQDESLLQGARIALKLEIPLVVLPVARAHELAWYFPR